MEHNIAPKDILFEFDPQKHIKYQPLNNTGKIVDCRLLIVMGASTIAITGPFKLLSENTVPRMRWGRLDQYLLNCQVRVEDVGKHRRRDMLQGPLS